VRAAAVAQRPGATLAVHEPRGAARAGSGHGSSQLAVEQQKRTAQRFCEYSYS